MLFVILRFTVGLLLALGAAAVPTSSPEPPFSAIVPQQRAVDPHRDWDPSKALWRGKLIGYILPNNEQQHFSQALLDENFSPNGYARGTMLDSLEMPEEFSQFQPAFEIINGPGAGPGIEIMLENFIEDKFTQRVDLEVDTTSRTERKRLLRFLVSELFTGRSSPGFVSWQIQQSSEGDEKSMKMPDGNNQMTHSDNHFHGGVYYIVSDNLQFMTTVYDNPRDKVGKLGLKYAVYSQDATGYHSSKPYCSVAEDDLKTLYNLPRDEGVERDVELLSNANHNDSTRVAPPRRDRLLKKKSVRTFFRVWFWHPVLARDSTLSTEMRMLEGGGETGTRRVLASFTEVAAEWGLQVEQIQNQMNANAKGAETESESENPPLEAVEHSSLADVLSSEPEAEVEAGTSTTSDIRSRETLKLSALVSDRDLEKCNTDPIADRPVDGCPLLFCRDWLLSGQIFKDHTGCQEIGKRKGASHVTYSKHLDEFRDEVLLSTTDGRPALGGEKDDALQKQSRLRQLLFYTAGDLPMGVLNTVRGTCHLRGGSTKAKAKANGSTTPTVGSILGDSSSAVDLFAFPHRGVHTRFLRYANSERTGRNSGEEDIENFLHAIQSNDYELGERLENTDVITGTEIDEAMQVLRQAGLIGGEVSTSSPSRSHVHSTAALFAAQLGVPLQELGRRRTASSAQADEAAAANDLDSANAPPPLQHQEKESDEERAFAVLKSFTSPITDMNFVTEQECSQKCHEYNQNLLPLWVHMFVGGNYDHLIPLLASKFGDFPAALNPRFCFAYTFVAVSHGGDLGAFYTPAVSAARLEGRCVAKVNNWDKDLAARGEPTSPSDESSGTASVSEQGATESRKKIWSKTRTISSEVGNVLTPTALAGTTAAAQALLRTDREARDCPGPQQAIELRVARESIKLSKLTIRPWGYSRYLAEQNKFLSESDPKSSEKYKKNAHARSSRRLQKLKLFVDGRDALRAGECSVVTNALYGYDERLAAASYDLYEPYDALTSTPLVLECSGTTTIEETVKIEEAVEKQHEVLDPNEDPRGDAGSSSTSSHGAGLWLCGVAVFGGGSGAGG